MRNDDGDRVRFQGQRYRTIKLGGQSYLDVHDDCLAFVEARVVECRRVLTQAGVAYVGCDTVSTGQE